jgi:L-lactate dehydrogenase complex protein LldF
MPYSPEVEDITAFARQERREVFLTAQLGISGVNFGVADSGALCLVTNEGNGRMVTTLPPVHVALMGVERLVPSYPDLEVMLRVLPRSATGQKSTSYISLLHGPRRAGDPDGPEERHVVLVDNGRMQMRTSPLSDALLCIRCGACLNACPVFREIGGHAYGSIYPGPIGSLVSPGLFGVEEFGHLSSASTLCGACSDVCPVGIDFPTLLLRARAQYSRTTSELSQSKMGLRLYAWLAENPTRFQLAQKLIAFLLRRKQGWIRFLPPPLHRWTQSRQFPPFARKPFRERIKSLDLEADALVQTSKTLNQPAPLPEKSLPSDIQDALADSLEELNVEFLRCSADEVGEAFGKIVRHKKLKYILAWDDPDLAALVNAAEDLGVHVDYPRVPRDAERITTLRKYAEADAGLTGASAAIADTGTLIMPSGAGRSQLTSLLPPLHIAFLRKNDIQTSLEDWMAVHNQFDESAHVLVTGPSRTADIEMTLSIGVHGPKELVVLCVE